MPFIEHFPRRGLVVPAAVPIALIAIAYFTEAAGHQWNIHGDAVLVFFVISSAVLIAFVLEILALQKAIRALHQFENLRTPLNLLCTALALVYVAIVVFCVAWFAHMVIKA